MKIQILYGDYISKLKAVTFIFSVTFCGCCKANDSWYVVNNYEGAIGKYPIHMSLQSYDFGSNINVEGSYYYDSHHAPIALYGKETKNSIELCEAVDQADFEKNIIVGEKYDFNKCPFKMDKNDIGLKGSWQSSKKTLDVTLSKISSMDKSGVTSRSEEIEIPFWGQTGNYSFTGVYEKGVGNLSISKINVLDKNDGRVVQVINPQSDNCDFGFYMTSIFQNVEQLTDTIISLNCYSTKSDISVEYGFNKKNKKFIKSTN